MIEVMAVFVFVFGAVIGSFLNVCIHRFPREESIVLPGSHCPHCKKAISWKHNIPVLSFLLLKGKCSFCQEKISPRYFFVELSIASIWLALWLVYGPSYLFWAGIVFLSILLSVTITDLETGYIPDKFTLPGMMIGLVLSAIFPILHGQTIWYLGLLQSVLGLLVGGGVLLGSGLLGNLLFRKDSMGGGDIKLLAMVGTFLGMKETLLVFFLSPLAALPFGLYLKFVFKLDTLPYGPFLSLAAAIFFIFGDKIVQYFF